VSASGVLAIPPVLGYWSPSLVAEAVGQLAAWSAMAKADFELRPLAGIAGEVRMGIDADPGAELELAIVIEQISEDAVAYRGSASVDGVGVLELDRCLGPMFPMRDYDAPDAMKERFDALCGAGAPTNRFQPLQRADMEVIDHEPGRRFRASLTVPEDAAFFADHFPRRPVYPATLLLDHQLELARRLLGEESQRGDGGRQGVSRLTDVKMRAFVLPGQAVEMEARLESSDGDTVHVALSAGADGRRVSSGRAEVEAGGR
jgi:3-hydroxymyristoyl/3-hydroxydecanoyl-(acyl carrier protein) dehydratase